MDNLPPAPKPRQFFDKLRKRRKGQPNRGPKRRHTLMEQEPMECSPAAANPQPMPQRKLGKMVGCGTWHTPGMVAHTPTHMLAKARSCQQSKTNSHARVELQAPSASAAGRCPRCPTSSTPVHHLHKVRGAAHSRCKEAVVRWLGSLEWHKGERGQGSSKCPMLATLGVNVVIQVCARPATSSKGGCWKAKAPQVASGLATKQRLSTGRRLPRCCWINTCNSNTC